MGKIINVDSQNFNEIMQFEDKLIVVDFWAPWCGPCKMLGPVLEKLTKEYDFILAKVNTEQEPDIAKFYNISSIPDVRLFKNMKEVDKFVGAQPEARIKKILEKHIKSNSDKELDDLSAHIESMTKEQKETKIEEILSHEKIDDKTRLFAAKIYIDLKMPDKTKKILKQVTGLERDIIDQKDSLTSKNEILADSLSNSSTSKTSKIFLEGVHQKAFEILITKLEDIDNKRESREKKIMIHMFKVLGNKDPLTNKYRVRLSRMLY